MKQCDRGRRDFVRRVGIATSGLLAGHVVRALDHPASGDVVVGRLLASINRGAAATIGRRALALGCVSDDPALLAASLVRDLPDARDTWAAFEELCRREFAHGRSHDFGGFALTDAECRLCALAALLPAA